MIEFRAAEYLIQLETAPEGLAGSYLLYLEGEIPAEQLIAAYRRLTGMLDKPVLNLVVVNGPLSVLLDFEGFAEIHRGFLAQGVRLLNLVVASAQPGVEELVAFGNEVGRLNGLDIRSRVVATRAAAFVALRDLMADTSPDDEQADGPRPGRGPGYSSA